MKKLISVFLLTLALFSLTLLPGTPAKAATYGIFEYDILSDGTVKITGYNGPKISFELAAEIDGREVVQVDPYVTELRAELPVGTYGNYEYVLLPDGSLKITGYSGLATAINIPSEIEGREVTAIDNLVFYYQTNAASVTIPNSVTSIGEDAFRFCKALESIDLPDNLAYIGQTAFANCLKLENISISDKPAVIGADAFLDTAYYNDKNNWEDGGFYLGSHLLGVAADITGEYAIRPGTTSITAQTFYDCKNLTGITIPDSVANIGAVAFSGCSRLTSVTIPKSVTTIDQGTFYGCTNLASVNIPDGVTSIQFRAFANCSRLTSIALPKSLLNIENNAFEGCSNLMSVYIPEGIRCINESAFSGCVNLKTVTIPSSVTTIEAYSFQDCESLTDVYYTGSEAEWNNMSISISAGDEFSGATVHFNSSLNQQAGTPSEEATQPTEGEDVGNDTAVANGGKTPMGELLTGETEREGRAPNAYVHDSPVAMSVWVAAISVTLLAAGAIGALLLMKKHR